MAFFSQDQLDAIARALGDTTEGLSGPEIEHLLASCKIADPGPMTKRVRIYNAFAECQNTKRNRTNILEFIRRAMKPARYIHEPNRYEPMRARLNQALVFAGLVVDEAGELKSADVAKTLPEALQRARDLRADLEGRGVHPDVLKFCRADDGSALVDRVLTGNPPLMAINALSTASERSEQSGFANLVRGTFGMFRNPTAHEARIHWAMTKEDAQDLMSIVSLIHRRLDMAQVLSRA